MPADRVYPPFPPRNQRLGELRRLPPPIDQLERAERLRTAVHEAGHFLVAELYPCTALSVHAISIAEHGPFAGGLLADTAPELDELQARALIAVLLAGFEAEWRLLEEAPFDNAITDLRQAHHLLEHLCTEPRQLESTWRSIQARVRRLLALHWDALVHVARLLWRETIVSVEDARAALREHVPRSIRYHDGRGVPPPPPRPSRALPRADYGASMRVATAWVPTAESAGAPQRMFPRQPT